MDVVKADQCVSNEVGMSETQIGQPACNGLVRHSQFQPHVNGCMLFVGLFCALSLSNMELRKM